MKNTQRFFRKVRLACRYWLVVLLCASFAFGNAQGQSFIYWNDFFGTIHRSQMDGSEVELILDGLIGPESMVIDNLEQKMFILAGGFDPSILCANLDGSDLTTIIPQATTRLQVGFGLDLFEKKIYYPDGTDIVRANYDGSNIESVVPDQPGARDVAIDTVHQKVYWIDDADHRVCRANLDGSDLEKLVTEGFFFPVEIALDLIDHKIYWTASGGIWRADLDGGNAEVIVDASSFAALNDSDKNPKVGDPFYPRGICINPFESMLYFTNGANETVNAYDWASQKLTTLLYIISEFSSITSCAIEVPRCPPDLFPPTARCKDLTITLGGNKSVTLHPLDVDNGSTDDCGIASYELWPAEFDCESLGMRAAFLTVTDIARKTDMCVSHIRVVEGDYDRDGVKVCSDCDDTDPNTKGPKTWCIDNDRDGFGSVPWPDKSCVAPGPEFVDNCQDCDDTDPNIKGPMRAYFDADGDGFGDPNVPYEVCKYEDGWVANSADCNDDNEHVNPNAAEKCNGIDDNCNGWVDDADPHVVDQKKWCLDWDGDGFGSKDDVLYVCQQPMGYISDCTDCDDDDASVGAKKAWYQDSDGDGFGNPNEWQLACDEPGDRAGAWVENDLDCDDNNSAVFPGADEFCSESVDHDCDGILGNDDADAVDQMAWYRDVDGDLFGQADDMRLACLQPTGFVDNSLDCDDSDATVYPGAVEYCSESVDHDCDGLVGNLDADASDQSTWFYDADGDAFGHAEQSIRACTKPEGYVDNNLDFDDDDPTVYPNAPEICDGKDNDGDGFTDGDDDDVIDQVAPIAMCRDTVIEWSNNGPIEISTAMINDGSEDDCRLDSLWLDRYMFDESHAGDNDVVLYVKDVGGNIDSCRAIVTIELSVHTEDPDDAAMSALSIFPNPTRHALWIVYGDVQPRWLAISDATGRVIRRFGTGQMPDQVDTHSLSPGLYFLAYADQKNRMRIRRFIKAK